jgi:hypothetical protein
MDRPSTKMLPAAAFFAAMAIWGLASIPARKAEQSVPPMREVKLLAVDRQPRLAHQSRDSLDANAKGQELVIARYVFGGLALK